MADVAIEITGRSAKAQAAANAARKSLNGLQKTTKKLAGAGKFLQDHWKGLTVALGSVAFATKKLVDLAAKQEEQERTLAAAMRQAGTFTEAAFKHNLAYAQSLQAVTRFGDENIITVQKMLTNFQIEGEMLDQLTKATLDLATAKGMDLKSAADLVAKTVGSSTNALSRYGITVEGAQGSTERAQMAVENISKIFGGSALASANTFAGSMDQMMIS